MLVTYLFSFRTLKAPQCFCIWPNPLLGFTRVRGAIIYNLSLHGFMFFYFCLLKSNEIKSFIYTRCSTPKRVTSLRGPSPRHCARATQLLSKKCCSGGEPLAALCLIWPARDLNLKPPAPETNALPLDQLAGFFCLLRLNTILYFCFSSNYYLYLFLFIAPKYNTIRNKISIMA